MTVAVEVYQDVCILKIMDDTGAVVDEYETRDILVKNYREERRFADPKGTLPVPPKGIH